jgi:hypothetical protein
MESLAAVVATIFAGLIALGIVNVLLGVLARRKKINFWISAAVNGFTALVSLWAFGAAWALAVIPFISVAATSIVLTWPKKPKED